MSLVSFARRTRVLVIDGRRFVCRPPTVATVARAYELILGEVWVLAKMVYRDGRELSPDDMLDALTGDLRFAAVLDTCVDLHGAAPGELLELLATNEPLQRRLALACAALVEDWPAVIDSLHVEEFGRAEPGSGGSTSDEDEPSEHEVSLWSTATACGLDPQSVADWPYEDLLAARKTAHWMAEQAAARVSYESDGAPQHRKGTSIRADASPDVLARAGISVPLAKRVPVN